MMIRRNNYIYGLIILLLLSPSCGDGSGGRAIEVVDGRMHPTEEFKPAYEGVDRVEVDTTVRGNTTARGSSLFSEYIQLVENGEADTSGTGILVGDSRSVSISRLDSSRFLILDKKHYRLSLYNTGEDEKTLVASQGGGPGSVEGASGIDTYGDTTYVSTQDMRIVKYTCPDDCQHAETTNLNFSARDISVQGSSIHTIGFAFTSNIEREPFEKTVQVVKGEEIVGSYGEPYKATSPIVFFMLNDNIIEVLDKNSSVLSIPMLPKLYTFSGGEISRIYEIDHFHRSQYEEGADPPSVSTNQAKNHSKVSRVKGIGGSKMIVTVKTSYWEKEWSRERPREEYEMETHYYLIDVKQDEHRYLGKIVRDQSKTPRLIPTIGDPVLVDSGEIFYFNESNPLSAGPS